MIKKICSRVAVMEGGKVVEEGNVYDIFRDAATCIHAPTGRTHAELELPQRLREGLRGTLLKILFLGDRAENPIISKWPSASASPSTSCTARSSTSITAPGLLVALRRTCCPAMYPVRIQPRRLSTGSPRRSTTSD